MSPVTHLSTQLNKPLSLSFPAVLLVEDNHSDAFLMETLIHTSHRNPFHVTVVPRMVDALDALDMRKYDIIILDLNLLDIRGSATVAAIHAESPFTPILVYSGTDDKQVRKKAMMCGATDYVVKDISSSKTLIHRMDTLLGIKAA